MMKAIFRYPSVLRPRIRRDSPARLLLLFPRATATAAPAIIDGATPRPSR